MADQDPVEFVLQLFKERGDAAYLGEPVSQTEHALQTAWAAEQAKAPGQYTPDLEHFRPTLEAARAARRGQDSPGDP